MTGILILAAGSSSRLGTAKQSLEYKGQTLLQRAVQTALSSNAELIAVILGANAETLRTTIHEPVNIFLNPYWEEGMASSIRYGLNELIKADPRLTSVILMLCDQPYVDETIINQLMEQAAPGKIIASAYNGTIGPPALFDREFFPNLLSLFGHEGAKSILLNHPQAVISIPFPLGGIDIDTLTDYDALRN